MRIWGWGLGLGLGLGLGFEGLGLRVRARVCLRRDDDVERVLEERARRGLARRERAG